MADNADDVADDYRQALEDLTMNSRIEIATLTNIARENASHGLAIAEVLTNHIKKVPPARTLPALYVLDSVVKNVPTPYALYFGPKLYSIFMGAYTKVDNGTRRKMDEMLKTWKEPVPGSISTKPVFPPEHVRPIEHALVAARQAAFAANQNSFQGQQQLLRGGRPPVPPTRDTPTPPSGRPPPHQAGPHGQQQFPAPNGHVPQAIPQQQPYPIRPLHDTGLAQHRTPPQGPPMGVPPALNQLPRHSPPAGVNIDKLREDVQQMIDADKAEFLRNPLDASKQTRMKALLDLQTVIQRPDVSQDQLMLIKSRLAEAVNTRTAPPPPAAAPVAAAYPDHTPTPPVVIPQYPTPVPPVAVARPPPVTAPVGAPAAAGGGLTLDSLLGQGALAALLSKVPKPATPVGVGNGFTPSTTPQIPPQNLPRPSSAAAMAAIRSPPPQMPGIQPPPSAPPAASALAANPLALLAALKQSGLIKPIGGAPGLPLPGSATPLPLPGFGPPVKTYIPPQFTMASLKQ
jgi:pre-mRNA cleavage complex 2 protein Pcf11